MKQSFPRTVTDAGMETDVSAKQLLKQVSPTLITDEGMTMELSAKQLLKQSLSKYFCKNLCKYVKVEHLEACLVTGMEW